MITTYSSFGFDTLHLYSCGLSNGFLAPQFTPNGSIKSGHDGHGQKIGENHKTHIVTEKKDETSGLLACEKIIQEECSFNSPTLAL